MSKKAQGGLTAQAFAVLSLLEQTSSRNKKIEILKEFKHNETLKTILKMAFDPYIKYHIKRVPKPRHQHLDVSENDSKLMFDLLHKLSEGIIPAGNEAVKAVEIVCNSISLIANKWLGKILGADTFQIGVGIVSINEVWPDLIPVFGCMLAKTKEYNKIIYPRYSEPKIDGMRCLIMVDKNGNVEAMSRKGLPVYNIDHIVREIARSNLRGYVFDGELWGKNWNKTVSVVKTQKIHPDASLVNFYLFDVIDLDGFKSGRDKTLWRNRRKFVEGFQYCKYINVLDIELINNEKEMLNSLKASINDGYEGIILKDMEAPYVLDRVESWIKVKLEQTYDGRVVDIEEGTGKFAKVVYKSKFTDAEYKVCENKFGIPDQYRVSGLDDCKLHYLGSIIVELETKDDVVEIGIGSGFKDIDRIVLYHARKWLMGKTIEFKGQLDVNQVALVRFPVFKTVRKDK